MFDVLIEFLRACPELYFAVADFLGEDPNAVSIRAVGCDPILSRYADGGSLRQFVFAVCTREASPCAENGFPDAFFGAVDRWLQENLPILPEGQTAQRFEIVQSASVAERDYVTVRYEQTYRLVYYQKGE